MSYLSIFFCLILCGTEATFSTQCGLLPADFVFLLDSSGSETEQNFLKQVAFLRNFSSQFTIGPNDTQFASVTFATHARENFDLKDNQNQQDLQHAVSRITYLNGETATDEALKYARIHSIVASNGGRPNVQKYVVVMTDGRSNESDRTIANAKLLKNQPNVKVIAIGIGNAVDMAELLAIATDRQHVFTVSNFDLLNVLEKELKDKTCTVCGDEPADIAFVLDSSGSEGLTNFQQQRQFVSLIVNDFDISATDTQVALATFSTGAYVDIRFQEFMDKPSLIHAIQQVSYKNGETRTDLGLGVLERSIFRVDHHHHGPRNGAKRFVVVLTDGRSNEEDLTARAAASLKQHVDEVFAIGIGRSVDKAELGRIATNDGHHVFTVNNFQELGSLHGLIVKKICEHRIPPPTTTPLPTTSTTTKKPTTTPTTTTTVKPECGDKPADVVFVLDSSESEKRENFTKQVNFVYNFAKKFEIGPKNVQFSTVTFSSEVRNDFYLNTYHHRGEVLHAIQNLQYMGAGTNTSVALNFVRESSFLPEHGGRQNATHIVIVITDGQSSMPTLTVQEAKLLKHSVDEVFSIGIGSQIDRNELLAISSNNHPFTVNSFDILHTIQESLENAACQN